MQRRYGLSASLALALTAITAAPASAEERGEAISAPAASTSTEAASEPFAWGDFTWLNGSNRQHRALLDSKYFTGSFLLDVNYVYAFARPKDHTLVGSTATFRANELELSFVGFGGDFHYEHARGRLMTQFGLRSTGVPRNDLSTTRGQFDLATAYRYLSEAYGGYHWDTWHGINLDVGIFMSYVGLFSYANFENWAYQPSYTSDNTPWFFNGLRLQTFPSDRLKVELWLINGWQTYGMFNEAPGIGTQVLYRPEEWISMLSNEYVGFDTASNASRVRFHSDNSLLVRYHNHPGATISKAAISITGDLGFESGGGVTPFGGDGGPAQNFISGMAYHRLWLFDDLVGWTFGGGFMHNPGRYLVLAPTGAAGALFTANPGDQFDAWDASTTLQFMPNEYTTWVIEAVHRHASIPYFAGRGGVTSASGYGSTNPQTGAYQPYDPSFKPDQRQSEDRLIFAMLFRM